MFFRLRNISSRGNKFYYDSIKTYEDHIIKKLNELILHSFNIEEVYKFIKQFCDSNNIQFTFSKSEDIEQNDIIINQYKYEIVSLKRHIVLNNPKIKEM